MQRVHQHLLLVKLRRRRQTLAHGNGACKIAADDLLAGCLAARLVVNDGAGNHVDAHIRRAFVGALAVDGAEHGLEHRENFNVAVIVDRRHAVGVEMERVDHVDVGKVCRRCLVSEVHRVLEWQIPDREGLVFGVACVNAALMLLIELAQARCHLARAGTRRGHNDDRMRGFDVVVFAVALVGDDQRNV